MDNFFSPTTPIGEQKSNKKKTKIEDKEFITAWQKPNKDEKNMLNL